MMRLGMGVVVLGLVVVGCASGSGSDEGTSIGSDVSSEVADLLESYRIAFENGDVDAVLGFWVDYGQWIADTPWGRDKYTIGDGSFNPLAFTNPIGAFVRWLDTAEYTIESRGDMTMITNGLGDIFVSYTQRHSFVVNDERVIIEGFVVEALTETADGLKIVKSHWLTPQTAGPQLGLPRPDRPPGW